MRPSPLLLLVLASLSSCGKVDTANDHDTAVGTPDQAAAVADLPVGQRNGVFLRAIRDAGLPCQEIASAERLNAQEGAMRWKVKCDRGSDHLIAIAPDGQAIVTSRTDQ